MLTIRRHHDPATHERGYTITIKNCRPSNGRTPDEVRRG
jgi:hypothetical protein